MFFVSYRAVCTKRFIINLIFTLLSSIRTFFCISWQFQMSWMTRKWLGSSLEIYNKMINQIECLTFGSVFCLAQTTVNYWCRYCAIVRYLLNISSDNIPFGCKHQFIYITNTKFTTVLYTLFQWTTWCWSRIANSNCPKPTTTAGKYKCIWFKRFILPHSQQQKIQ